MACISGVIITYNEESNIARCIRSMQLVVDEIVVLDSFSTDKTQEICRSLDARFFQHTFDNFVSQKNRAVALAQYDYILSLDADEELDTELVESVQLIKPHTQAHAYFTSRITNYCGHWIKHGGWHPDRKIRLFNRTQGEWTGDTLHEKWKPFNKNQRSELLKGHILHHGFPTLKSHWKRVHGYSDLSAKALLAQGKSVSRFRAPLSAAWKWISQYIFQLGFLDGKAGWNIAKLSAAANYYKYRKLYLFDKYKNIKSILISRTDGLGDVVLTLPMAGFLKKHFPNVKVYFLGTKYTQSLIESCQYIDGFIDRNSFLLQNSTSFDAIIHVSAQKKLAFHAKHLGFKLSIGTIQQKYHWFTCSHLIYLRKMSSNFNEAELGLRMLSAFGIFEFPELQNIPHYYGLEQSNITPCNSQKIRVIFHPKSHASAPEWGLNNYSKLAELLPVEQYEIIITGSTHESNILQQWLTENPGFTDATGKYSLKEFISFIKSCHVLVASSTGPLHLAAALGLRVIGVYSPIRGIFPTRWGPIGQDAHALVPEDGGHDVQSIRPERVAQLIMESTTR